VSDHDDLAVNIGVGSWPRRRARISPHRLALVQDGRSLTYADLADRAGRLAGVLVELGVGPRDVVAYHGANDIATFETLFATGLIGAVLAPLNTRLAAPQIEYLLADSTARVLVHGPQSDTVLAGVSPPPSLRHVLALQPDTSPLDACDYRRRVQAADPEPGRPVRMDDPAVLLYTSGTTGSPKGVLLSHANLTWNMVNQLAHLDIRGDEQTLCLAPLFHCVGLCQLTLPTFFKGGTVTVMSAFDAAAALATIRRRQITAFGAVPTMLQMMCRHPAWPDADLGSLRNVVHGGAPMPADVAAAWMDRGVPLTHGYGMTEASPGIYMGRPETDATAWTGSIGSPHFFTDVALSGPDDNPAPDLPGATGELLVRGPHVFSGYWNQPRPDTRPFTPEGWFRTGDLIRIGDAPARAHLVDRVKDLIISGGENIAPSQIEAVALAVDEVAEIAVVAVPDPRWGEVGAAYVKLSAGARPEQSEAVIRAHLQRHLARFEIPRYLWFVDDLPRSGAGKIQRAALRQDAADRIRQTAAGQSIG
jgi:fatty-acyl-CoA synthase